MPILLGKHVSVEEFHAHWAKPTIEEPQADEVPAGVTQRKRTTRRDAAAQVAAALGIELPPDDEPTTPPADELTMLGTGEPVAEEAELPSGDERIEAANAAQETE
jgi:hypothetical protein